MIYINTDKSKFLGKRVFKAKKMTKDEFLNNLNNMLSDKGYTNITDLSRSSLEDFYGFLLDIDYFDDLSIEIGGAGVYMQDYSDLKEQWKFQETIDGFCYIELYTSIGDEATKPLYNILYFDEDCNLQVYVPFCGNLVDIISKVQLFTLGGYDGDSYEQLFDKYESYLFSKYEEWMIEDSEFCEVLLLDCIGKEYGIDGVLPDLSTVDEDSYFEDIFGCYFFDMFDINIDLCREDINSNVKLV